MSLDFDVTIKRKATITINLDAEEKVKAFNLLISCAKNYIAAERKANWRFESGTPVGLIIHPLALTERDVAIVQNLVEAIEFSL